MRKSILRFGALALMSLMSISSWAQNVGNTIPVQGEGNYKVLTVVTDPVVGQPKGTVALTQALSAVASLTTIQDGYGNTFSVTEIAEGAYKDLPLESTTDITVPANIKKIEKDAFYNENITVSFAESITEGTELCEYAFRGAKFKAFAEGKTFEDVFKNATITDYVFSGADLSALGTVLDLSAFTLKEGMFYNATFANGTEIRLGAITELPAKVFGAEYTVSNSTVSGKNDIATIVMPREIIASDGLTTIGESALKGRTALTNFGYYNQVYFLPSTLKTLGDYALAGCTALGSIQFDGYPVVENPSIKNVGKYAFEYCSWMDDAKFALLCKSFGSDFTYAEGSFKDCKLVSVDLSASTVEVGKKNGVPANAFRNNPISTLTLPNGCVTIGDYAFWCNHLRNVTFPEGLETVGSQAFATAYAIVQTTDLYLPSSLKSIGTGALSLRTIPNVYAHPLANLSLSNDSSIPTIGQQTSLIIMNMYIPAMAAYVPVEESQTKYGIDAYIDKGWESENLTIQNLNYASEFSNPAAGEGAYSYAEVDGVKYKVGEMDGSGFFTATVCGFDDNIAPTIYGGLVVNSLTNTSGGNNGLRFDDVYNYPIVLKVTGFENNIANNSSVTEITFKPADFKTDEKNTSNFTTLSPVDDYSGHFTSIPVTFQGSATLEKVTIGKGATSIAAYAFKGCTNLEDVNFAESDITTIEGNAFENVTSLTSISLPNTLTTLGSNVFKDSGLTEITLPTSLVYIYAGAFDTESLKDVTVSYATVPAQTTDSNERIIFHRDVETQRYTAKLHIGENVEGAAKRHEYITVDGWKSFFGNTGTFTVVDKNDEEQTVCEDETGVFVFDDNVKSVTITNTIGTDASPVAVQYKRAFNNTNWQAVSLPFDVPAEKIAYAGLEVAELYNVRLNPGTGALEAVVWVKLKNDKTMEANKPYVIKAKETGENSIKLETVVKQTTEPLTVDCSSTKELYTLTSNFGPTNMWDAKGYYLGGGKFNWTTQEKQEILKPYRFYMTRIQRPTETETHPTYLYGSFSDPDDYDTTPEPNVKVVVLDDEEEAATYINSLNVRDAENLNAPMYDITGRQIVSPVKGQVYIQNGVKKLAK